MSDAGPNARPALWAGLECTVNRVRDRYFDQIIRTGHHHRADDIDRLADLGVEAIRYPVLWERTERSSDGPHWHWADERLGRLRDRGVRPIVGLVHHGSGPVDTSLVDPRFPERLAAFAGRVARRYPWVTAYTPVNEPLTTARFSGLYGHWYPHGRDERTFARALVTQCRSVVLAMRAIRAHQPDAMLIQTEDLGQIHSSPALRYQADFENARRWLSYDLLSGRVDPSHEMWAYLQSAGIPASELMAFVESPCMPDVFGINHYLTSERFLDDRIDRYPADQHGGNGRDRYVDVEAVRVLEQGPVGIECLLGQAWERYRRPVAVTEVHLGCTRDEQMRWLVEVWRAACAARTAGVDVRAITAWTAFGSFDWNSLVTRDAGCYEPGLFDARSLPPRPTALAGLVRDLAAGRDPEHPVLDVPGWWRRADRLLFADHGAIPTPPVRSARRLLIAGGTGTLGRAFGHICESRGLAFVPLNRRELDIADPDAVATALDAHRPWAVVNAAGYARVDDAEAEPDRCRRDNSEGPAVLAEACGRRGIGLLTFSSDFVFDGRVSRPYREQDSVAPLNVYGASKAEAERRVLEEYPSAFVVRTSGFFGPWDERNFVHRCLRSLTNDRQFAAADDIVVTPTYLPDLVNAALDLLIDGASGVWHLANPDSMTWADLAREVACRARLDPGAVIGKPASELGWRAPRPAYAALGTDRGTVLPPLFVGLDRYFDQVSPTNAA